MAKILIIEDNEDLVQTIRSFLVFENHVVESVCDGSEALSLLSTYDYDAIILDWELPKLSGIEICEQYRQRGGGSPILMLTGKDSVEHKLKGLNIGADDYLTKPFDLRELGARLRALLRRPVGSVSNEIKAGNLTLDLSRHKAYKFGEELTLAPREYQLLEFMARHPNQVLSSETLLNRVWPTDSEATDEALRTTMKRMRKKVDPDNLIIKNVHGVGFIIEVGTEER